MKRTKSFRLSEEDITLVEEIRLKQGLQTTTDVIYFLLRGLATPSEGVPNIAIRQNSNKVTVPYKPTLITWLPTLKETICRTHKVPHFECDCPLYE